MKKIWRKIINGLILIKNFLLIFFKIKNYQNEVLDFIDDLIKNVSLINDVHDKKVVVDDIVEFLNKLYGEEYVIQHTTVAAKLVNKIENSKDVEDFAKEIKNSLKESFDLKSFLISFVK